MGINLNGELVDLLLEFRNSSLNLRRLSDRLDSVFLGLKSSDLLLSGCDLVGEGGNLLGPGIDIGSPVSDLG